MRRSFAIVPAAIVAALLPGARAADFEKEVRPLLTEYCNKCHSTEKQKGDLDLERFTSVAEVKKHPKIWEGVLEQLANKEMPPKEKPQLNAEQKKLVADWVQATLDEVALASAGDPGPVVLRRLSNSEYTYTVRDLTGVPTLNPAKEFPIDGAAGEGFDNAGAALVMSPALLGKYLEAGKDIASHAVLLPTEIRFSAGTTSRDWTDEILANIRGFYASYSEAGGASSVDVQGVKFDTNAGGRLPVERYLTVLMKNREALREGRASVADVAKTNGVSSKYLGRLWQALNETKPSLLLDDVRARFRVASPEDVPAVARSIQQWQQFLWRFSSVGHIGKRNGPKSWQQSWTPLGESQEMRVQLSAPADGSDIVLYLVASDAGDGGERDFVLWENARVVAKNKKETLLRAIDGALPERLDTKAPGVLEVKIPAELAKEAEFVVMAKLPTGADADASVQVQVLTAKPDKLTGLTAGTTADFVAKGLWSDNNQRATSSAPILVKDGSAKRERFASGFDEFRDLFPAALCYTKIVPTDEVVTLMLFYREDDQLKRLMLDDAQAAALDRMWESRR